MGLISRWVRRRLHHYKVQLNNVDNAHPVNLSTPQRAAVIGSGIAGLIAATTLAERGFEVDIYEKNAYLGGKTGAWPKTLDNSLDTVIDHGFHAFFTHYYNCRDYLTKIGADRFYKRINDYFIISADGTRYSFKDVTPTPLLNIFSLAGKGFFKLRSMLVPSRARKMMALLRYQQERTFEEYDSTSFHEFAEDADLPEGLRLVFTTFSRAFFADQRLMSMAELIKSFHFFYLSNDNGLLYDYFDRDYQQAFLTPAREYLEKHGVTVHLESPVASIEPGDNHGYRLGDTSYPYVILTTDVQGTSALIKQSQNLAHRYPDMAQQLTHLKHAQGYAVLKVWADQDIGEDLPPFIITDRRKMLDAITFTHHYDAASKAYVAQHGGGVYELHCYAVPQDKQDRDTIYADLIDDLKYYMPAFADATIHHADLQFDHNFTAYHTGLHSDRPTVRTDAPGLFLAGDWVKTESPAMLLEAAATSALLATNEVFKLEGLQEVPVYSVPTRGIFARRARSETP